MSKLSVAIVILNWNGKKLLEQFLPTVIATTYPNTSVIVVDNASTDDSITFIQQKYPTIRIIQHTQNEGFAGGYNKALQQITADIFVLLNSDVAVTPHWVEPIVNLFMQEEALGICQPKILSQHNQRNFDYAGAAGGYMDKWGYPFAKGRVLDTIEKDTLQYEGTHPIFWASGAAFFIRATIYKTLGGLDESFFAHQEEIDLCWRTQLLGYNVKVCTASVVYHVGGATLEQGSAQKTYLNFRNNLLMLYKNLPWYTIVIVLPIRFMLDAVAAYQFLFKGNGKFYIAIAKAHLHFINRVFTGRVKKHSLQKKALLQLTGTTQKSIVYQYYILGKKTFTEIFTTKA